MKKILVLLILISTSLNANALEKLGNSGSQNIQPKFGFIGDIIDDVKDDIEDKFIPFRFRVRDFAPRLNQVSNEPRRVKLFFVYNKDFKNKIFNLGVEDFEDLINENLEITTKDFDPNTDEGDDEDFFDANDNRIVFTLENGRKKSGDSSFLEAEFISNEITINDPQKLNFKLDIEEFLLGAGIKAKSFSKTPEKKLRFFPITIELNKVKLTESPSLTVKDEDVLNAQTINLEFEFEGTFESNEIDSDSLAFEFTKNFKKKTPSAFVNKKGVKRKLKMTGEEASNENPQISKIGNLYQIKIPVRLQTEDFNLVRFLKPGKKHATFIPFRMGAFTDDGLPVLIRGFARGKASAL